MTTEQKLREAVVSFDQAKSALDSLDDCARMNVGVDAFGSRGVLERFIEQQSSQAAEIAELKAENEALRKDAARYRWLRDPCSGAERVIFYRRGDYGKGLMSGSMLDAEIDNFLLRLGGASAAERVYQKSGLDAVQSLEERRAAMQPKEES